MIDVSDKTNNKNPGKPPRNSWIQFILDLLAYLLRAEVKSWVRALIDYLMGNPPLYE
ncbi:hypothetical protein [Arthrobacter flavus]|uniref:Transposase n=1 Tax=Arthrobacter flavus TaxID=95172 RepID=A0ABW4Q7U5_9MICC